MNSNINQIANYTHSVQRNLLIEELGGFRSKKIENLYLQQRPKSNTLSKAKAATYCAGHDLHRRLTCKTELQHYNVQKEEIERLLQENSEYNKEVEARRQKEMVDHVKQRRLQTK